jgi:hypothetical protein
MLNNIDMQSNVLQIRVILDVEADVFRDLELFASDSLEALHLEIVKSFGLEAGEMASFYASDDEWGQGMEVSLEPFGSEPSMKDTTIGMMLQQSGDRMLFVYDFLNMWTFFVELIREKLAADGETYPRETLRFGERPQTAPEKDFGNPDGTSGGGLFDDAFDNEEDFDGEDYGEEDPYA